MTNTPIHPTLEAVARAICRAAKHPDHDTEWSGHLPEARAALVALADEVRVYEPSDLREIAAEPKPTVEDVLAQHRVTADWHDGRFCKYSCGCGWHQYPGNAHGHDTHVADMLRAEGLVNE